jgi:hypothetical protein
LAAAACDVTAVVYGYCHSLLTLINGQQRMTITMIINRARLARLLLALLPLKKLGPTAKTQWLVMKNSGHNIKERLQ